MFGLFFQNQQNLPGGLCKKISVFCAKIPCDGRCPQFGDFNFRQPFYTFWERWEVAKGETSPNPMTLKPDDSVGLPTVPGECGIKLLFGTVRFYYRDKKDGGIGPLEDWTPEMTYSHGFCGAFTGKLPSIGGFGDGLEVQPEWWTKNPVEWASRFVSIEFNCCPCINSVDARAFPNESTSSYPFP